MVSGFATTNNQRFIFQSRRSLMQRWVKWRYFWTWNVSTSYPAALTQFWLCSWFKPISWSTIPAFTETSAVSSGSRASYSRATLPFASGTWFTSWSFGANPVSTPSFSQVRPAAARTSLCSARQHVCFFFNLRARLFLSGCFGSVPAARHEVRLLSHRHAAQLPPSVKAAQGSPGRTSFYLSPASCAVVYVQMSAPPCSPSTSSAQSSTPSPRWPSPIALTWCWSCSPPPCLTGAALCWTCPSGGVTNASTSCLRWKSVQQFCNDLALSVEDVLRQRNGLVLVCVAGQLAGALWGETECLHCYSFCSSALKGQQAHAAG